MAGDTYTSPFGLTPAGTQLQGTTDLLSTLKAIPGIGASALSALSGYQGAADAANNQATAINATLPQYTASQQANNNQAASLPQAAQAYGSDADLYKLFIADHQAAQQFMRPDVNTPGSTVQQTPDFNFGQYGITTAMPMMTNDSLTKGFQGFTSPVNAESAANTQGQGIIDALNNVMKYYNYNSGVANDQTTMDKQTQLTAANALTGIANTNTSNYNSFLNSLGTLQGLGLIGGANSNPLTAGGMSMSDYTPEAGTSKMTVTEKIRRLNEAAINAPNDTARKNYQDAADKLTKMKQLSSAEQTTYTGVTQTLQMVDDLQKAFADPATRKRLQAVFGSPLKSNIARQLSASHQDYALPTIGLKPEDSQLLSDINSLATSRDRQLLGGRVTGYLYKILLPGSPDIGKTISQNQSVLNGIRKRAVQSLKDFAQNKGVDITDLEGMDVYGPMIQDTTPEGSSKSSPVAVSSSGGNQQNRQLIVNSLKKAGKSDDWIHAYLRQKGIDN